MPSFLRSVWAQAVSLLLLLQAGAYYGFSRTELSIPLPKFDSLPVQIGDWSMTDELTVDAMTLERLQPDAYLNRTYKSNRDGLTASVFIGYFETRRTGRAPHSPKSCLPGNGWEPESYAEVDMPVPNSPNPVRVNRYVVKRESLRLVILYWYHQNGRLFTSEVAAQFYSLPNLLLHRRTDTTFVRVGVPVAGEVDATTSGTFAVAGPVLEAVELLTKE
ncbi:MAG: EpsI family protein [Bryobacteraceae bacterium]